MDEKRFEEILVKRLGETEERIKNEIYKKMDENDERLERKIDENREYLENKIDENREYLENKIDENREYLENKIDKNREYLENKIDENREYLENKIDKNREDLEQKIIDNSFYFEHTYGEKISAIFDKLQLDDDLKKIENEENVRIKKQVEKNSAKLMSHEFRISKIEQKINSKKI